MENLEKLKELFRPVFEDCGVRLYELIWTGGKEKNLQVSIMKPDGSMDLDTCAAVSEKLSEVLDREDPIESEYTLEVCSPGAEREIKDLQELDQMTGVYVFLRLKAAYKNMTEITGEITAVDENTLTIAYRDKAVTRNAALPRDEIAYARLAVRF